MSSRLCCGATDPTLVPAVSMMRSMLMVVGRRACAIPNPVASTSLNHPRLAVVQGTPTIACCRNSSTSSEVTTTPGRTNDDLIPWEELGASSQGIGGLDQAVLGG